MIFPWWVTLTHGFTSCNSSIYNNTVTSPTHNKTQLGITRNLCCSPCPYGAWRVTYCMWGAFIFHGQVQSTACPCEIWGKLPQGQLRPYGISHQGPAKPHRCGAHPFKEWTLWHSQPTHKIVNAFTCSKSARESELSSTSRDTASIHCCSKSISQDVAFTVHCSKSSRMVTDFKAHCSTWGLRSLLELFGTPWSEPYSNWQKASSKGSS